MFYFQKQSPSPTDGVGVDRQMSPYLLVDDEGLVPEEYVSLVPEEMIPVALEAEVEESMAMEEGKEVIWFYVPPNEEEENQAEAQEEDCDRIHSVEEGDDDDDEDDEANYEYTEKFTGRVNDHTYERAHYETKEAECTGKDESENENQEVEDGINPK